MGKKQILSILLRAKAELDFYTDDDDIRFKCVAYGFEIKKGKK